MINHARTLLLNRRAVDMAGVTGYEYIDPSFYPVTLPRNLQRVRDVLFAGSRDKFGEHEVTARLVQIMHHPELEPYTLAQDGRYTYNLSTDVIAKAVTNPLTVTRYKDTACDMTLHYRLSTGTSSRIKAGQHRWRLSPGNIESIRIQYGKQPAELYDVVARHATVTADIPLVRDYLSVYFDIPSGTLTGDYLFTLDLVVPMVYNFATIMTQLEAELARADRIAALFDNHNGGLDLSALQQTWIASPETLLRIGAISLALVAQTQYLMETRNG